MPTKVLIFRFCLRARNDSQTVADVFDIVYETHWEIRDALVNHGINSKEVEPSVIEGQHIALKWFLKISQDAWDDVRADT